MARLRPQKYKLAGGGEKVNCYNLAITRKVAEQAGITPDDNVIVRAEGNRIVVEKVNDESNAR